MLSTQGRKQSLLLLPRIDSQTFWPDWGKVYRLQSQLPLQLLGVHAFSLCQFFKVSKSTSKIRSSEISSREPPMNSSSKTGCP